MIIRIVKMEFKKELVDEFIEIFEGVCPLIKKQRGCHRLDLLRDVSDLSIFFTYSTWSSETDLEAYRQSELFKTTWARTKRLFSQRAQAWTTYQMI